jgi:hypothetical protein
MLEFFMSPYDKGENHSPYVARALDAVGAQLGRKLAS